MAGNGHASHSWKEKRRIAVDLRYSCVLVGFLYDVKLDRDTLQEEQIILAFGIDGQPLPGEDAPVRLIIPDSDSAWWVRMVRRLQLQ